MWSTATCTDPLRTTVANGKVCIGWSGSATTVGNLQVIAEPVRALASRDDVRVQLVGVEGQPLPGVEAVALPWRAETEVEDLRRLDVGLLPVPLNEWNKRKFFMKLVQYMALGIPAVCTPLGSNPEVVEEGRTGFLADSPREWVEALERLVGDPDLRAAMGGEVCRGRARALHAAGQCGPDRVRVSVSAQLRAATSR